MCLRQQLQENISKLESLVGILGQSSFDEIRDIVSGILSSPKLVQSISYRHSVHLLLLVSLCFEKCAPQVPLEKLSQLSTFWNLVCSVFRVSTKRAELIQVLDHILDIFRATDMFVLTEKACRQAELVEIMIKYSEAGVDFAVNVIQVQKRVSHEMRDVIYRNLNNREFALCLKRLDKEMQKVVIANIMSQVEETNLVSTLVELEGAFCTNVIDLLVGLQRDIVCEDEGIRTKTVSFCVAVIKQCIDRISVEHEEFIELLLGRHVDIVDDIRMQVVELCFSLLKCKSIDFSERISQIIQARMSDFSWRVREKCWAVRLPIDYKYEIHMHDRVPAVRNRIMQFYCEDVGSSIKHIDLLLQVYDEYRSQNMTAWLCCLRKLLAKFGYIRLYEMIQDQQHAFFEVITKLLKAQRNMKAIMYFFNRKSAEELNPFITYDLWAKYLPSSTLWRVVHDRGQVLQKTCQTFANELYAVIEPLNIDIASVCNTTDTDFIKKTQDAMSHSENMCYSH